MNYWATLDWYKDIRKMLAILESEAERTAELQETIPPPPGVFDACREFLRVLEGCEIYMPKVFVGESGYLMLVFESNARKLDIKFHPPFGRVDSYFVYRDAYHDSRISSCDASEVRDLIRRFFWRYPNA